MVFGARRGTQRYDERPWALNGANMQSFLRLAILSAALASAGHGSAQERSITGVRKGMSAQDVRQLMGTPNRVVRQLLYRRHIEQWVYENPQHLRIGFNCVRGEDPGVTAVLTPHVTLP